ncbi:MAG: leucine-rich repeat domain-containing protein, partial [Anaerovoracaceae bacterium]
MNSNKTIRKFQAINHITIALLTLTLLLFTSLPSQATAAEYDGPSQNWVYDSTAKTLTQDKSGFVLKNVEISKTGESVDQVKVMRGNGTRDLVEIEVDGLTIGINYDFTGSNLDFGGIITDKTKIVDGKAKEYAVNKIASGAFKDNKSIEIINLTEVTDLPITDSEASTATVFPFSGCSNLKAINFPKLEKIPNKAFKDCKKLESAYLIKATEIGDSAFENCETLISANFKEARIVKDNAFANCDKLIKIQLNNSESVGKKAFYSCDKLQSVELFSISDKDGFEDDGLLIGESAFEDCKELTIVKAAKTTELNAKAFKGCSKLKSINLQNVKTIGNAAFSGCSLLNDVNIYFSGTYPTDGENAVFKDCHKDINIVRLGEASAPVLSYSTRVKNNTNTEMLKTYGIIKKFVSGTNEYYVTLPPTVSTIGTWDTEGIENHYKYQAEIQLLSPAYTDEPS